VDQKAESMPTTDVPVCAKMTRSRSRLLGRGMSKTKEPPKEKICPDCVEEGHTDPLPISEFYAIKAKGYAGGYRYSAYCKRHTAKRNVESRAERLKNNPEALARKRLLDRQWAKNNPEKHRRRVAAWAKAHPEKVAAMYQDWANRNPEKRRKTREAFLRRKSPRTALIHRARVVKKKDGE
jgi:hypothetical protein